MAGKKRQTGQDRNAGWASGAFIRKAGIAALTSFSLFFLIVYINTGRILPWQGDTWPDMLMELGLFFLLLLAVLWSHARIAALMRKPWLQSLPSSLRATIEAALVAGATLLFNYTFMFLPIFYLLDIGEPPEGRVRTVLVISGALSLFFYYFVERERGRKRLQAELLRSEQLQKENFRANRQVVVHIKAVEEARAYFKGRRLLELRPAVEGKVVVSSGRAPAFREWLEI